MASVTSEDMAMSRSWTDRFLSGPAGLLISFLLDGERVAGIDAGGNKRRVRAGGDATAAVQLRTAVLPKE